MHMHTYGRHIMVTELRELQQWVSLLMNIKMCYKRNRLEGWLFR